MKMRTRRRVAAVVATSLVGLGIGITLAPSASAGGLILNPSGAVNSGGTTIQYLPQPADDPQKTRHYEYGGSATYTYLNNSDTSTVAIFLTPPSNGFPVSGSADTIPNKRTQSSTPAPHAIDFTAWPVGQYGVRIKGTDHTPSPPDPLDPPVVGSEDSCTDCFTVTAAGPTTVSAAGTTDDANFPTTVLKQDRANKTVTFSGTNFEKFTKVDFLLANGEVDPKITVAPPGETGVKSRTTFSVTVTVAADATRGARTIRMRNLNGQTAFCSSCMSVEQATMTGVSPGAAVNNDVGLTTITIKGTEIPNGTPALNWVATTSGSSTREALSIIGQNVRNASATSITADFDLRNAAPGQNAYQPIVRAADGSVAGCTCRFTIIQPLPDRAPYVLGLDSRDDLTGDQNSQPRGSVRTFAVRGNNFSNGVTFQSSAASAPGVITMSSRYLSPTLGEVTLFAQADAALGNRDITARLTDSTTSAPCSGCHFVSQTELDPPASPRPCPTASPSPSPFPAGTASPTPSPTPSGFPSPSPTPCVSASPSRSASPTASPTTTGTPSPAASDGSASIPPGRYVGLSTPRRAFDSRQTTQKLRTGLVNLSLDDYIPGPATAAVLNVTIVNATSPGHVVVFAAAEAKPSTSNVNFIKSAPQANEVVTRISQERDVSISIDSTSSVPAQAALIVDVVGYFTPDLSSPAGRISLSTPRRIFDSARTSQARRRGDVDINVSSAPAGTSAVVLNITVDGPDQAGYLVAFPAGSSRPGTSNVNFLRGQQQANEVITDLGTARHVTLTLGGGRIKPSARVLVDLVGTISATTATPTTSPRPTSTRSSTASPSPAASAASGPVVLSPVETAQRVLDTRRGSGNVGASSGRKSGLVTLTLPSSVPADAKAVVLNVTTTGADLPGYVTVYPGGTTNPGTSNVNFRPGVNQANEVLVAVGANRTVNFFVGGRGGPLTYLIADITATLAPGSSTATPGATASASPTRTATATPRPTASGTTSPSASPTLSATPTGTPSPTCSPLPGTTTCAPMPPMFP